MDPVDVPADRWWGAQMERSRRNFRIGDERMPDALIRALAVQKQRDHRGGGGDRGDVVASRRWNF
ncbi:hypothetical protein [Azospirillum griseum]|uniref:hypothetical protein n=1 Tax=Azospirillum griseum TaxID=2496639 RepID=UPI001AED03AA